MAPDSGILLRQHREKQGEDRRLQGGTLPESDLVFSYSDGTPIAPDAFTDGFRRLARRLGFWGIRFHNLRHTYATLLLEQGVRPKIVSERLGHSSVAITLDTYSHVLPGLQKAVAHRLDEALHNAANGDRTGDGSRMSSKGGF